MKICEIFNSIQGESTLQGVPTVFIRTAGCNLSCSWCDSAYARLGDDGYEKEVADIIADISPSPIRHVCITGGEPLLQDETYALVRGLSCRNYEVSVETNGTVDAAALPLDVKRVIDIKCPSSGEEGKTCIRNIHERRPSDEFKFVCTGQEDFDYALSFINQYSLEDTTVLFSPASGTLNPASLAEWIVSDAPFSRLNLQLHRFIWPHETRGR
jgi:7-carboxy-7-deazaguanine synthase